MIREDPEDGEPTYDRLVVDDVYTEPRGQRSPQELFKLIKAIFKKNYQSVEAAFYDIDELNSGRLSQEMMYKLLRRYYIYVTK